MLQKANFIIVSNDFFISVKKEYNSHIIQAFTTFCKALNLHFHKSLSLLYMETHFKFNIISTNPFHKVKYGSSTADKWNVPAISINIGCHGHQWLQPPPHRDLVSPGGSQEEKNTCHLAAIITSLIAQPVKNPPAMQETPIRFLGPEDSLEKG